MKKLLVSDTSSHGIAIGPVYLVREEKPLISGAAPENRSEMEAELAKYDAAVEKTVKSLTSMAAGNKIFVGHISIARDIALRDAVKQRIYGQGLNAERAADGAVKEVSRMFLNLDDTYMRERAADVTDVGKRLVACMQNRTENKFAGLKVPSVIVAESLLPSDTAALDKNLVLGFITEQGGVTSHVSIMAGNLGIPALVGAAGIMDIVSDGSVIVMDAAAGEIYVDPDRKFADDFLKRKKRVELEQQKYADEACLPTVTRDGHGVKVYANVGNLNDIEQAASLHADGVGLFRTEFLYMESSRFPTEEEQFNVYRKAVERLGGEMVIRTLDIGGDKKLSYYQFMPEANPFLGLRAIRLCLRHPEVFKTQLRAILRASHYGRLRIMLPMMVSLEEAEQSLGIISEVKRELSAVNIPYDSNIPVGMMVETPAAVICAGDFAKVMDFFSIGTNDMTQYTLAADRCNKEVGGLYSPLYPSVLRSVKRVIDEGHKAGIKVGMCGEFAADKRAAKLLLGLGLDEFSMSASCTPAIKSALRGMDFEEARGFACKVVSMEHISDIKAALEKSYGGEV